MTSAQAAQRPPEHLSEASKALWRAIVRQRISAGRAAAILAALEHRDRALAAREIIKAEGLVIRSKRSGIARVHPLCAFELQEQTKFERLWLKLNLHFDPMVDGVAALSPEPGDD